MGSASGPRCLLERLGWALVPSLPGMLRAEVPGVCGCRAFCEVTGFSMGRGTTLLSPPLGRVWGPWEGPGGAGRAGAAVGRTGFRNFLLPHPQACPASSVGLQSLVRPSRRV